MFAGFLVPKKMPRPVVARAFDVEQAQVGGCEAFVVLEGSMKLHGDGIRADIECDWRREGTGSFDRCQTHGFGGGGNVAGNAESGDVEPAGFRMSGGLERREVELQGKHPRKCLTAPWCDDGKQSTIP